LIITMPGSLPQPIRVLPTTPHSASGQSVDAARRGEAEGLSALYHEHASVLLALAARLMGEAADAEDVVHDLFVTLPTALRLYEERGNLRSWLKRLTVRIALNALRSQRRAREVPLTAAVAHELPASALDDSFLVLRAVDALPASLRVVIVLKVVEGYSHAEIASALGISTRSSEVRLHRALHRLRRQLGGHP
jgi:RNA polymerase sigma-70 factor (ECF subfamily)